MASSHGLPLRPRMTPVSQSISKRDAAVREGSSGVMSALGQKQTCAVQLEMPALGQSRHDRPHSSTLATKQEKRIRQRPPVVIVPLIVAAPRHIVPIAPGKKEAVVAHKGAIVGRLARYKP